MIRRLVPLAAVVFALAACDGNPFRPGTPVDPDDPGIDSPRTMPPGTPSPTPSSRIVRREPRDPDKGSGYLGRVTYDAGADTFTVSGLGFDGTSRYTRGRRVGSLGPYAIYENPRTFRDPLTNEPIGQFTHRAIYGVSSSGQTEFAIVRTGAYTDYGFGGFIYQRNGNVVLPTSGQAGYSGRYAGLRDFEGRGGLEYAIGDMTVAIDFDAFEGSGAVRGAVSNRTIFDVDGNDITADVVRALSDKTGVPTVVLPTLVFKVGPGALDRNGEILGDVFSATPRAGGAVQTFEEGRYYAIVAGNTAEEIVGVLVVEADDPRYSGVTVRETGGFLLSRP